MTNIPQAIAREGRQLLDQLPAVRESVRETLGSLQARVRGVDARTRALVQERPLTALAAAVAVGFLLRRLLPFGR